MLNRKFGLEHQIHKKIQFLTVKIFKCFKIKKEYNAFNILLYIFIGIIVYHYKLTFSR